MSEFSFTRSILETRFKLQFERVLQYAMVRNLPALTIAKAEFDATYGELASLARLQKIMEEYESHEENG